MRMLRQGSKNNGILGQGILMTELDNGQFHMDIPSDVEFIIRKLENAGFEAYAVGGCVRDTILKRTPGDWDITTSAFPGDVKKLFRRTIDTGIKHGTVTVMLKAEGYEITTYRIDGVYTDSRHPESVEFTSDLAEDLKRRDFTINAMAYNPKKGLVDIYGGISDLNNKIIRCVGNAEERFNEDALRIVRAVRFAAQLGFEIEESTKKAITKHAPTLVNISKERIQSELEKIITSDNPGMMREAYELGITKVILPEFDKAMETSQNTKYHIYSVGEHIIRVMEGVPAEKYLRLTALLHDIGKPECKTINDIGQDSFKNHAQVGAVIARRILKDLKYDNKTVGIVTKLIECHMDNPVKKEKTPEAVRRSVNKIGKELYPMFLTLRNADIAAKNPEYIAEKYEELKYMKEVYNEILKNGDCVDIKELAVSGKDIIKMGVEPGERVGEILNRLLDEVLKNPELNTKEILSQMIKTYI